MATIKARKEEIRVLIDRQRGDTLFSDEDTARFNELTGWNFRWYKKVYNQTYPNDTRCVAHSDDGATFVVWSWNRALSPANNMLEAMRVAVKHQTYGYMQTAELVCVTCGSKDFIAVDHKNTPFKDIAQAFCAKHGDVALTNSEDGSGWRIADYETLRAWQAFHEQQADYQILCRSCNSKKGARNGHA